jgi:hypothetical protein
MRGQAGQLFLLQGIYLISLKARDDKDNPTSYLILLVLTLGDKSTWRIVLLKAAVQNFRVPPWAQAPVLPKIFRVPVNTFCNQFI